MKFRGKIEGNWWYVRASDDHISGSWEQFWALADKKTVGEYTGLLDKQGKDIYEGDIVQYGKNRGLIKDIWTYQWLQVEVDDGVIVHDILDKFRHLQEITGLERSTIIGNVYENPNLLAQV